MDDIEKLQLMSKLPPKEFAKLRHMEDEIDNLYNKLEDLEKLSTMSMLEWLKRNTNKLKLESDIKSTQENIQHLEANRDDQNNWIRENWGEEESKRSSVPGSSGPPPSEQGNYYAQRGPSGSRPPDPQFPRPETPGSTPYGNYRPTPAPPSGFRGHDPPPPSSQAHRQAPPSTKYGEPSSGYRHVLHQPNPNLQEPRRRSTATEFPARTPQFRQPQRSDTTRSHYKIPRGTSGEPMPAILQQVHSTSSTPIQSRPKPRPRNSDYENWARRSTRRTRSLRRLFEGSMREVDKLSDEFDSIFDPFDTFIGRAPPIRKQDRYRNDRRDQH